MPREPYEQTPSFRRNTMVQRECSVEGLNRLSLTGHLGEERCDITITIEGPSPPFSNATIRIASSCPEVVENLFQLTQSMSGKTQHIVQKTLAATLRSSRHEAERNNDTTHFVEVSEEFSQCVVEYQKLAAQKLKSRYDIGAQEAISPLLGTLTVLYECNNREQNPKKLFNLAHSLGFRDYVLGPLSELVLRNKESLQTTHTPRLFKELVISFCEYCDTRNEQHVRILGRLLGQNKKVSLVAITQNDPFYIDPETYIDEKIYRARILSDNGAEGCLSIDQLRRNFFKGLIEAAIHTLDIDELKNSSPAIHTLTEDFVRESDPGEYDPFEDYNHTSLLAAFNHLDSHLIKAALRISDLETINHVLQHWNDLDDEAKQMIVSIFQKQPVDLFVAIDLHDLSMPPEIQEIIFQPESFQAIWKRDNARPIFITYVESFSVLPTHILKRFIEDGYVDTALLHKHRFTWNNDCKQKALEQLIQQGRANHIIENIDFFPAKLFERGCRPMPALRDFRKDTTLYIPKLYEAYKAEYEANGRDSAKVLMITAQRILDATVNTREISTEYRNHVLYPTIFEYAFGSNTDYTKLLLAKDRSGDLELFEIPPKQNLDLLAGRQMILRNGLSIDDALKRRINRYLVEPQQLIHHHQDPSKKLNDSFKAIVSDHFSSLSSESIEKAMLEALTIASTTPGKQKACRRLAVLFHAIQVDTFGEYISASQDRVDQAPNREYAFLLEAREFTETIIPDTLIASINSIAPPESRTRYFAAVASLFEEDIRLIDTELTKYIPQGEAGNRPPIISAFFSKNSQSVGMPFAAGVCVAGDVPRPNLRYPDDNMWALENYFNLVFRNEDTKRCVGGILLHYIEDGQKSLLSASLNPSSSLLYKVDEERFFDESLRVLIEFAEANEIDMIATSIDEGIRTNRTGGVFEQALKRRIRSINSQYSLSHEELFSFTPHYTLQHFDILWEKPLSS